MSVQGKQAESKNVICIKDGNRKTDRSGLGREPWKDSWVQTGTSGGRILNVCVWFSIKPEEKEKAIINARKITGLRIERSTMQT